MSVMENNISAVKVKTDQESVNKYLSFYLDDQRYGLNILNIKEIISLQEITKIPKTEKYVCGVINLRGQIITVLDLRLRFGMPEGETNRDSCVVVIDHPGLAKPTGLLVDGVSEVLDIDDSEIDDSSESDLAHNSEFINGIGKHGDSIVIILNVNSITNS